MNQWFIFGSIDSPVLLKPFKRDSIIKLTLKVKREKGIVHLHLQVCESSVDEVMKVFPKGNPRGSMRCTSNTDTLLLNFIITRARGRSRSSEPIQSQSRDLHISSYERLKVLYSWEKICKLKSCRAWKQCTIFESFKWLIIITYTQWKSRLQQLKMIL